MEPEPGGVVLDEQQARARLNATGMLGATFTPDCARIHPLRLARGLADVVERRGGVIYEGTRVRAISSGSPGMVETDRGTVRAGTVIRATEGYTHFTAWRRTNAGTGVLTDRGDRATTGKYLEQDRPR